MQGIKVSVEDGTTSANAKTITSPTHSKSVSSSSMVSLFYVIIVPTLLQKKVNQYPCI
jgi:hypothetical protein